MFGDDDRLEGRDKGKRWGGLLSLSADDDGLVWGCWKMCVKNSAFDFFRALPAGPWFKLDSHHTAFSALFSTNPHQGCVSFKNRIICPHLDDEWWAYYPPFHCWSHFWWLNTGKSFNSQLISLLTVIINDVHMVSWESIGLAASFKKKRYCRLYQCKNCFVSMFPKFYASLMDSNLYKCMI